MFPLRMRVQAFGALDDATDVLKCCQFLAVVTNRTVEREHGAAVAHWNEFYLCARRLWIQPSNLAQVPCLH